MTYNNQFVIDITPAELLVNKINNFYVERHPLIDYCNTVGTDSAYFAHVINLFKYLRLHSYSDNQGNITSYPHEKQLDLLRIVESEDIDFLLGHKKRFVFPDIELKDIFDELPKIKDLLIERERILDKIKLELENVLDEINGFSNNIPLTHKIVSPIPIFESEQDKLEKVDNVWVNRTSINHFIWIDNNCLCFFPSKQIKINNFSSDGTIRKDIYLYKIPLGNISYYAVEGEVIHENKISGGGGGGADVGGAIVGGLIAGAAGAIIGGRKKIESIKSELVTHDNRSTILYFKDVNNKEQKLVFTFLSHEKIIELLQENSVDIKNTKTNNEILSKQIATNSSPSLAYQIRELGKLRDEGLITEREFQQKKKQLLNL
jgi:hypothetical protein